MLVLFLSLSHSLSASPYQSSHLVALDRTGSNGWSLKVELQSINSIATGL